RIAGRGGAGAVRVPSPPPPAGRAEERAADLPPDLGAHGPRQGPEHPAAGDLLHHRRLPLLRAGPAGPAAFRPPALRPPALRRFPGLPGRPRTRVLPRRPHLVWPLGARRARGG